MIATQYDHPTYVQHVLASNCLFITLLGYSVRGGGGGGVGLKGLVNTLLMQFFTLGSSNIEVSEI